ncbi:hypothetical protein BDN72DRAFT_866173 [Pluteus cervinus]|uniref:Uncharacterized protein n=1 Tax=Pluteus cervinus TaxID=181527 RepID=A0ACD2ZXB9_9AGAR|nr:hypothetical protein BDN72DRAFT_866173 [Pluteus cervinus]
MFVVRKEECVGCPVWLKCQTRTKHGNSDDQKNDIPAALNSKPRQELSSKSTGIAFRFDWYHISYQSGLLDAGLNSSSISAVESSYIRQFECCCHCIESYESHETEFTKEGIGTRGQPGAEFSNSENISEKGMSHGSREGRRRERAGTAGMARGKQNQD